MSYVENNYYPAWVPLELRSEVNLGELAPPTPRIIAQAESLAELIGKHIAVYIENPRGVANGLCSFFRSACLESWQLDALKQAERRLDECAIVAYEKPLERLERY